MAGETRNYTSLKWRYYGLEGGSLDFWGTLIFGFDPIIPYQRINIYRVQIIDMGRFCWNNGVSGKCNPRVSTLVFIVQNKILWEESYGDERWHFSDTFLTYEIIHWITYDL